MLPNQGGPPPAPTRSRRPEYESQVPVEARTPPPAPQNVNTTTLAGVERASTWNGWNVTNYVPEQDYSSTGIRWREEQARARLWSAQETAAAEVALGEQYGYTEFNQQQAYDRVRYAHWAYLRSFQNTQAPNLERYPTLAAAAFEADLDEGDVARLVNYVAADDAAEQILAYGRDLPPELAQEQINNILSTAGPVMSAAIWDVVSAKLEELPIEEIEDPTLIDTIKFGVGKAVEAIFTPLEWLNEQSQHAFRANLAAVDDNTARGLLMAIPGVGLTANAVSYWDKVEEGNYDQQALASLRQEHGDLAVDLFLSLDKKIQAGDEDPLISLFAENVHNPEAMEIIRPMFGIGDQPENVTAIARAIDGAHLGNTGQYSMSLLFGDNMQGTETRDMLAGLTNVAAVFALDPTILGAKLRGVYLGVKYAMGSLAPGATTMGVRSALGLRQTNRYFNELFADLNRYDELVQSNPAKASLLRERISRQYAELPDQAITELTEQGIRTVDDLGDYIIETNAAFLIQQGRPATELVRSGARVRRAVPLADQMIAGGSALTRVPLMPRMGVTRYVQQKASRGFGNLAAPKKRGYATVAAAYGDETDPAVLADRMNEVDTAVAAAGVERGGVFTAGAYGKATDSLFRWFASLPGKGFINIEDASDARLFYRYARTYLSRTHATYLTDRFRAATPGDRYKMLVGLNRTAAASRGLDVTNPAILARVDELMTATKEGTRFAPPVPAALVRAQADEVAEPTVPVYRVDSVENGINWDKPQGLYTSPVDDPAASPHRGYIMDEAGGEENIVEFSGRVRESDVFDVTPAQIDFQGLRNGPGGPGQAWVSEVDAGVGYVVSHMDDGEEWLRVARNRNDRVMTPEFEARLQAFDPDVDWGQYYDNYERLMAVGGIQARRDGHKVIRFNSPPAWDGAEDLTELVILDRSAVIDNAAPAVEPVSDLLPAAAHGMLDPSNFNGTQMALFGWQTASHVAIPSMRDMELLRRWRGVVPAWLQNTPQAVTDAWSLGTLFGWRFAIRNSIEDLWFYSILTGGSLKNLYQARRASTALRETRGRTREKAFGGRSVPALGRGNRTLRAIGDMVDRRDNPVANAIGRFIQANLDPEQVRLAHDAAMAGDFGPMRTLAGVAMTRARFTTMTADDITYVEDLVSGPFGIRILDDITETGKNIQTGGDYVTRAIPGTEVPGVSVAVIPRESHRGPTGDWIELPLQDGARPESFLAWERSINGALMGDGPAGEIAVAYLDDTEEAVRRVADEIRTDPTGYGYMNKFAALNSANAVTVEEFARRKVLAVRTMFSDRDGNLNRDLWRSVVDDERNVVAYDIAEDGSRQYRVTAAGLREVPVEQRPRFAIGREYGEIPTPSSLGAFADRTWTWMGEQYARISREPVFIANYLEQRKQLARYQRQLTEEIGERAARRHVSRLAEDRAYHFTLSYVDNPQNRSKMAWKVRNVSRYYRATEDFYRRIARVGRNNAIGLWKTSLLYDSLDDTGFTYTNDEGEKYFIYPGSEFLHDAMNGVFQFLYNENSPVQEMGSPFMLGGKVNMISPSWNPDQQMPSLAGPFGVMGWRTLQRAFPELAQYNEILLGEIGAQQAQASPNVFTDALEAFMPGQVSRVLSAMDGDERDALFGGAMKDAIASAVANGWFPEPKMGPDGVYLDPATDPEVIDAMASLRTTAWAAVAVRVLTGFAAPASPQLMTDDVPDFTREMGVVDWRSGFLDLVAKVSEGEDAAENPYGLAKAMWDELNPGLFPYTVSGSQPAGESEGEVKSLAPLKFGQGVYDWYKENENGLIKEFPGTAYFLAPQEEGFSWSTWTLIKAEGFRESKNFDIFLRDVWAAQGEQAHNATYADYQADIDRLDPRDPDQRAQITALETERSQVLEDIRDYYPWWKKKYIETREWAQRGGVQENAFYGTKAMVDHLYETTPPEQWEGSAAQWIRNAILTYIDYQTELGMITGSSAEDVQRRQNIAFEMEQTFAWASSQNANAALFIRNVLAGNPQLRGNLSVPEAVS